jgi:1-aminocyclopropane-1-carboxylate deaminase/D-cysteine desulfhydrase-like pyridoxal-dependent ACC family enzyme
MGKRAHLTPAGNDAAPQKTATRAMAPRVVSDLDRDACAPSEKARREGSRAPPSDEGAHGAGMSGCRDPPRGWIIGHPPGIPMSNALFHAFPFVQRRLPWMPLGDFPTPVEWLPALDVWVKRDDRSGALYGGNKVRRLEFLLADATRRRARRILTLSAFGSHHLLATTLYGRREGFEVCGLVCPQPSTADARDTLLLSAGAGACLHRVRNLAAVPLTVLGAMRQHRGNRRVFLPPGGSSPLGALGYAAAALELAEQVRAGALPLPDAIFVPLGSGGTAAGLAVGMRLARLESTRLVAVRVFDRLFANAHRLARLADRAAALLRAAGGPDAGRFRAGDFQVVHDQFGRGYGRATEAAQAALRAAADCGLRLEATYTAKALAAVLHRSRRGERVLFWNTFSSVPLEGRPRAAIATLPASVRQML